jgi:hypothetical protein
MTFFLHHHHQLQAHTTEAQPNYTKFVFPFEMKIEKKKKRSHHAAANNNFHSL